MLYAYYSYFLLLKKNYNIHHHDGHKVNSFFFNIYHIQFVLELFDNLILQVHKMWYTTYVSP